MTAQAPARSPSRRGGPPEAGAYRNALERCATALVLLSACALAAACARGPVPDATPAAWPPHAVVLELERADDGTPRAVLARGPSPLAGLEAADGLEHLLSVRALDAAGEAAPHAMLGQISAIESSASDGALRFEPALPFARGQRYVASWKGGPELRFTVPRSDPGEPARVLATYPSGEQVPANLLRIYLTFSRPMSRGEVAARVHLLEEDGQPVAEPFVVPLGNELWNAERTRLTLILDPGRVKRGLPLRDQRGPVLVEGHGYRLLVDRSFQDGQGNPLAEPFEHRFVAGPRDQRPPTPGDWRVLPPTDESPLVVMLPEPLDYALALSAIEVRDAAQRIVAGAVSLTDGERRWSFAPAKPWATGRYELVVTPRLEDPAGNALGHPFEIVGGDALAARGEQVSLGFLVE